MNFIFDVDGVLLNFFSSFQKFMLKEKQIESAIHYTLEENYNLSGMYPDIEGKVIVDYINEMNNHPEYFSSLDPIPGASKSLSIIKTLFPDCTMSAVTSAGASTSTYNLRKQNLKDIGFDGDLTVLPLGGCKKDILSKFPKNSWFIDDLPYNIDVADELGLNTILFSSNHNQKYKNNTKYQWANDWNDCIDIIKQNCINYTVR